MNLPTQQRRQDQASADHSAAAAQQLLRSGKQMLAHLRAGDVDVGLRLHHRRRRQWRQLRRQLEIAGEAQGERLTAMLHSLLELEQLLSDTVKDSRTDIQEEMQRLDRQARTAAGYRTNLKRQTLNCSG